MAKAKMNNTQASIDFCIHNLTAMVIKALQKRFPNKNRDDLITEFCSSNTYKMLCNYESGLWAEGPDYILDFYGEEIGIDMFKSKGALQ